MENGKQWFHNDSNGLHLLFESFTLEDSNNIWTGYLLVWMICTIERCVTYHLDKKSSDAITRKRLFIILQRTLLYGIATTMRLLYMLVIMYFNTGLFILVVVSLTLSQLFFEVLKLKNHQQDDNGYSDLISTNDDIIIPKIVISNE
ncbi:hypothetical protein INT46_008690 [Mucor plumbeus]|uniref:Copper transport protein n=1 Tax=Mucor plumbeus TaxID=97098 RepID=A0A8H7V378_9FUNG|nr:hypothetical protein INT46_008690 [Mucor plumbeus]